MEKNGCQIDGRGNPEPSSQTLVVFDSSGDYKNEPLSEKKIASIINQFEIYINGIEQTGHILSFWHFGKKTGFEKNEPTGFICLAGKYNWFNRPPEVEMEMRRKKEMKQLKFYLNKMNKDMTEKGFSPLIDTLITITDSPWAKLTTKKEMRELIFISDLLEKSKQYDFYKKAHWKENKPEELAKNIATKNPLNLNGMPINIFFIKRQRHIEKQGKTLERFWVELFLNWKAKPDQINFESIR